MPLDTIKTELVEVDPDSDEELNISRWMAINRLECERNDIQYKNTR